MKKWHIYWANVKYEEGTGEKRRPVLIINETEAFTLCFKMTSKDRKGDLEYRLIDWKEEGLSKPTTVRIGKKLYFKRGLKFKEIGSISSTDKKNIVRICKENNINLNESLKEDIEMSNEYDSEGNQLTKVQADFFRNSKARDREGRLLVCYRRDSEQISEFDKTKSKRGWLGNGFYFSTNKQYIRKYGKYKIDAYLNMRNPYYFDSIDHFSILTELKNKFNLASIPEDTEILELLIDHGYDGMIYTDWDSDVGTLYVAFEPNQIKSITNKEPSYSNNINEETLLEKDGYHFGDLNVAKKAERRSMQGGYRGTGHFGTGFYMIGNLDQNTSGYNKRDLWKIDLDKYNLFKPSSENDAFTLHCALKVLNSDIDLASHDYDDIMDKLIDIEELEFRDFNKARWELEELLMEEGFNRQEIDYILEAFDSENFGQVTYVIKDYLKDKEKSYNNFTWAVKELSRLFGKNVEIEAMDAITSEDQTDSKSTVFMKSLGYEGVDVTDLKGKDNFEYGSVVYDLKPGTFEKVEKMNESVENQMSIDDFIDKAEVILVDDAENFDINEWEKKVQDEIDEELEEKSSEEETSQPMFVKYKISQSDLKKVVDKLKKSSFDTLDGVTSWKTRQFLKKNNLTVADLQEMLRSIGRSDYRTNSIPTDKNSGYNDAIIFVKTSKIKEIGPFRLYIKLDYDRIEETPVIIISIHSSGKVKSEDRNESLNEDNNKKTIQDYFNECVNNLRRIGYQVDDDIKLVETNRVRTLASMTNLPDKDGKFTLKVDSQLIDGSEESILNTLYHELAHYLVNKKAIRYGVIYFDEESGEWYPVSKEAYKRYDQHQEEWNKIKDYINMRLGTQIEREQEGNKAISDRYEDNAKYTVECNNCHNKFYYYRKSRFVNDILNNDYEDYECPYCKAMGDFTLIEK